MFRFKTFLIIEGIVLAVIVLAQLLLHTRLGQMFGVYSSCGHFSGDAIATCLMTDTYNGVVVGRYLNSLSQPLFILYGVIFSVINMVRHLRRRKTA